MRNLWLLSRGSEFSFLCPATRALTIPFLYPPPFLPRPAPLSSPSPAAASCPPPSAIGGLDRGPQRLDPAIVRSRGRQNAVVPQIAAAGVHVVMVRTMDESELLVAV